MKTIGQEAAEKIVEIRESYKPVGVKVRQLIRKDIAEIIDKIVREHKERGDEPCQKSTQQPDARKCSSGSNPAPNVQPAGAGKTIGREEATAALIDNKIREHAEADTKRLEQIAEHYSRDHRFAPLGKNKRPEIAMVILAALKDAAMKGETK